MEHEKHNFEPLEFDDEQRYLKLAGNPSLTFTKEDLTGKPEKQELRKVEQQIIDEAMDSSGSNTKKTTLTR